VLLKMGVAYAKAAAREVGLAESGWATVVEPPLEPELEPLKEILIWLFKIWSQKQQLSVASTVQYPHQSG